MLPDIEVVQGKHDRFLCFKTEDLISRHIRKHGSWGETEAGLALLMSEGFANPLVLDIGANLGAFTVPVAKHLGQMGGVVHAFEPQRIVFQQLCGNVILNRLDNVVAHHAALGSASGITKVPRVNYQETRNIGAFSLISEIQSVAQVACHVGEFEEVRVVILDEIAPAPGCTFVKMDVEGYESEVLQGAISFLENSAFPPIFFEEWRKGKFSGVAEEAVAQRQDHTRTLLSRLGYVLSRINTDVLAQHPRWRAQIALAPGQDGAIQIVRER